ncbi:MAG: 4Fe-4S cluster-binding domain-containing protein, partial [Candidatus Micrarchaeia archaeon]
MNLEKLKKYGIIVEKEEDDEKEAIENIMKTRNTNVFSAVFSITYKCNFNCVYCFEKSNKIMKKEMSEEVLLSSLNWCEKMIKYLNFSYISVVPFGGEPLLNFRGI